MDVLPKLYPDVVDLLAIAPEDIAPLLLKFALIAEKNQNGMFQTNYVNQLATGDDNLASEAHRYSPLNRKKIEHHLGEAWLFIESERFTMPAPDINGANGFKVFTKKGREIADNFDPQEYQDAAAFPKSLLHPLIREKVSAALLRNDLGEAVLHAFTTVEIEVRSAADLSADDIGVKLMFKAFNEEKGPLTDKTLSKAERIALANLFAGGIGSYKNPHSHRTVNLSELREAQEQVLLASHLLRIVDSRRRS